MPVKEIPEYYYSLTDSDKKQARDVMEYILSREKRKEEGAA